jgi:arylsulfatase A-like enzyme
MFSPMSLPRRSFLGWGAACAAVAQDVARRTEGPARFINKKAGLHPFRAATAVKRPHIFLITLDMVTPDHYHPLRAMHQRMELPAIKSLFADSVFFSNAFCASPLCAPARAALATGRYPYITANGERAHDGHETILRPTDVIFQEYLKATGYRTKHAGKGHLGTQKFMDAFDENDNAWDRWAPPVHDDELYLAHLRRLGVKRQRYRKEITGLQQDRKTPQASLGGWIEQADGKPFPMEAQYTHYLVDRAVAKLDAALEEGGPVYLQLDIFDPHQPFSVPGGLEKRERELRSWMRLPESYETVRSRDWRGAADEPKIYNFYQRSWGLYDAQTVLDYRVAHALQMEVIDRALARFFGELKRRGIYDEALIVFTADHGEMNGRRAVVDKGVYLYPDVLRVPLAVKMPRSAGVRARSLDAPVSHLDLAPTILELTGIEPLARQDGVSLLPLLNGKTPPADRAFLFECGWHTGVNFACAVQSGGKHLYTYNLSSEVDELYDMEAEDPVNLAGKAEHRELHREMVRRLGAFVERDPRWIGYWHSFRVDHYHDLPKPESGDYQMFRPI